jgi:uncharacterized protein (DUF849 family)
MLLQATLNGPLTKSDHPSVPVTLEELVTDAADCAAAGARAFHVHPRDISGAEALGLKLWTASPERSRMRRGCQLG